MALLAHRCKCSHVDYFHKNNVGECSFGWCKAKCRAAEVDPEPEIIPTFIWTGNRSESDEAHLHEPGKQFVATINGIKPCGCERCQEIHAGWAT